MRTRLHIPASRSRRGAARRRVDPRPRHAFSERTEHTAEDRALLRLIEKLKTELRQQPSHRVGDVDPGQG